MAGLVTVLVTVLTPVGLFITSPCTVMFYGTMESLDEAQEIMNAHLFNVLMR